MVHRWGVGVRRRTVRQTEYVCPRCGVDRLGSVVEPQRWFSAIGLPIVPLAVLPNEIWCNTCSHQSDLGALDVPTTEQLTRLLELAVRSSIASVVKASPSNRIDAEIDPTVIALALDVMRADGHDYDEADLEEDLAKFTDADVHIHLRHLVGELTPHGKQMFLRRAAAVAVSDGSVDQAQQDALTKIGAALEMSGPHIHGVLAVAMLDLEAA